MPRVLVSCCGLPAAGKTTFCRAVVRAVVKSSEDGPRNPYSGVSAARVFVRHVCFDDYVEKAMGRARETGDTGRDKPVTVNGQRVQHHDVEVRACDQDSRQRVEEAIWWHEGRREALAVVESLAATGVPLSDQAGLQSGEGELLHVVLADDNMHFRSMRHEVLNIARSHECGYAQLFFPIDVSTAITRDDARESSVQEADIKPNSSALGGLIEAGAFPSSPETENEKEISGLSRDFSDPVIRKMAGSLQPPDPERFPWERYTAVVEASGNRAETLEMVDLCEELREGQDRAGMCVFWAAVAAAAKDPVSPVSVPVVPSQTKEADREATATSALHKLDLDLREATKKVAETAAQAGLCREALTMVMKTCSSARKDVMKRARAGERRPQAQDPRNRSNDRGGEELDDDGERDPGPAPGGIQKCNRRKYEDDPSGDVARGWTRTNTEAEDGGACNFLEVFSVEFKNRLSVVEHLSESMKEELVVAAMELDPSRAPRER